MQNLGNIFLYNNSALNKELYHSELEKRGYFVFDTDTTIYVFAKSSVNNPINVHTLGLDKKFNVFKDDSLISKVNNNLFILSITNLCFK